MKLPDLASMLDWRKAKPAKEISRKPTAEPTPEPAGAASARSRVDRAFPRDPIGTHARRGNARSLGRSRARARPQLREWFDELTKLSVPDAVSKIRDADREQRQDRRCAVIALPFNDYSCLGSITEVIAELVENQDPVITELAQQHSTREGLIAYIRGLPQRDDDGEKNDGPKVEACAPPQRLRIPADDPNCVERAALYLAVAEIIDPKPVRQLATLDTPVGHAHVPARERRPVILDPRVTQSCLDCGVAIAKQGPSTIDPHDALEWTTQLAERNAAATRNGPSRVRRARNAVIRLVEEGIAPTRAEADSIGWMFAIAERAARRWGTKALAMVRTTALAIAEVADEVLARTQAQRRERSARRLAVHVVARAHRDRRRHCGAAKRARDARHRAADVADGRAGAQPRRPLARTAREPAAAHDVRIDATGASRVTTTTFRSCCA